MNEREREGEREAEEKGGEDQTNKASFCLQGLALKPPSLRESPIRCSCRCLALLGWID